MNQKTDFRIRLSALLLVSFCFVILLWMDTAYAAFLGFAMIAMTVISLKTEQVALKGFLVVISLTVTFPLYVYLLFYSSLFGSILMMIFGLFGSIFGLAIVFAPFYLLYFYLARDFWDWINKDIAKYYLALIAVLFLTILFFILSMRLYGPFLIRSYMNIDFLIFLLTTPIILYLWITVRYFFGRSR